MSQFPPFHKHKAHFIFSILDFFLFPLLFPCTNTPRCYCLCFIFPLFISKICHHYWEHKAANSFSFFSCAKIAKLVLQYPFAFRFSKWFPLPPAEQRGGHWVTHICKPVVLPHFLRSLPLSSCTWASVWQPKAASFCHLICKGHFFLPSLPNIQHKVTGCSKYIYIGLALFTSDAAKPFVSFSSQLHSLKLAPNTIFFQIPLAEALTLCFHAVLLQ